METQLKELTRRDRNKLRNRREILDAALEIFAAKGYHQASMQAIADRADFAVSTLYALFENKEDLYRKVSADVGRQCGEVFDTAMARGGDPYEKLIHFARAKGDIGRINPDGNRMLENELHDRVSGDVEPPPDGIAQIYDRFMLRIEKLFAQGIADGLFVDHSPALLAMLLDSMTNALMKHSTTVPGARSYDDSVDEAIAIFFGPVLKTKPTTASKG